MTREFERQIGADLPEQAIAELERYCRKHPRSPTAVRGPRLMLRGQTFFALLGSSEEDGIVGIGDSVEATLQAFDAQYANASRRTPRVSASRNR